MKIERKVQVCVEVPLFTRLQKKPRHVWVGGNFKTVGTCPRAMAPSQEATKGPSTQILLTDKEEPNPGKWPRRPQHPDQTSRTATQGYWGSL